MIPLQIHQFLAKQMEGVNSNRKTVCVYHRGFGSIVSVDILVSEFLSGVKSYSVVFIINGQVELFISSQVYIKDFTIADWAIGSQRITHLLNPHTIFNYSLWHSLLEST